MPANGLARTGSALANSIRRRLDGILAAEFPTESPAAFGQILREIVLSLEELTLHTTDIRIGKYACESLRTLAGHLQYIETANSARVPASLIGPVGTLVNSIVPNARVLLCAQWDYNYTVFDVAALYREMLSRLIGKPSLDKIIGKTTKFFIVAVPAVEELNILLHSLLGHEIGHEIATRYLGKEDQKALMASIWAWVGNLTWLHPDINALPADLLLDTRRAAFDKLLKARNRALEELISDLVAYALFGISAVFAMQDMAATDNLDALPEEQYDFYPPWRLRLRTLFAELSRDKTNVELLAAESEDPNDQIKTSARERLEELKKTVADSSDWTAINSDELMKRAYRGLAGTPRCAGAFVRRELVTSRFSPKILSEEVAVLIDRITLGIPPDENKNGSVPDFRSAIAAGWFYHIGRLPLPYTVDRQWESGDDETLNRLVLKAVESIVLRNQFAEEEAQTNR